MRSGRPIEAIDVYLKIISAYPIYKMIPQFKLMYKDRPSFLGFQDLDDEEVQSLERGLSMTPSQRQGGVSKEQMRRHFVPDSVIEFDELLGKACSICEGDDLDSE